MTSLTRFFRYRLTLALLLLLSLFTTALLGGEVVKVKAASPLQGSTPWAVIMCKFADRTVEPQNQQYFKDLFTASGAGKGGLYDYWQDMSYGNINLQGSDVKGWYTISHNYADESGQRLPQIQDCINAAASQNAFNFPDYYGIAVVYNAPINAGSASASLNLNGQTKSYALLELDSNNWDVTFTAHEMGHGFGLDHSFDQSGSSCGPGNDNRPGAYCDSYDIMSAKNFGHTDPTFQNPTFGSSGPSLSAPYRYALNWIPGPRTWTYGIDSTITYPYNDTITLADLNTSGTNGYLIARVGTSTGYYMVEFRRKQGWDRNIASDGVIIHAIDSNGLSYLVRNSNNSGLWQPGESFSVGDNAHIKIESFDPATSTAKVNIGLTPPGAGNPGGGGGGGGGSNPPCRNKPSCVPHAE